MPSEVQISIDLMISRGIVREAFRPLSAAGVLEVGAGRSPKVGALNNVLLTLVMRHALSTRQVLPDQVLDLRCSIEVRGADLAAEMCTAADITNLRAAVAGMKRSPRHLDRWVQRHVRSCEIVSCAAVNPLFQSMVGTLRDCIGQRPSNVYNISLLSKTGRTLAALVANGGSLRARNWNSEVEVYLCDLASSVQKPCRPR